MPQDTGKSKSKLFYAMRQKHSEMLCVILILLLCTVHGWRMQYQIDFYPMNGTFQNFNPIRRFLAGQVPYRDFSDYLGLGHLLLGSIATWIWGGTYAASVSAFTALAALSTAGLSCVLGSSVLGNRKSGLRATALLLAVSLFLIDNGSTLGDGIAALGEEIAYAFETGKSAHLLRCAAAPLFVVLLWFGLVVAKRIAWFGALPDVRRKNFAIVYCGLCGGAIFSYSNDFGISSWLCFGLTLTFIALARTRKLLPTVKTFFLYFLSSGVGLALFVSLVTRGNLIGWLKSTFGTGGYQGWYYIQQGRSFFFTDVDRTQITLLQAFVVLTYLFLLFKHKGTAAAIKRFGIPAALNMTSVCAANEYKLLSGGYLFDTIKTVLVLTALYEALAWVRVLISNKNTLVRMRKVGAYLTAAAACTWIVSVGGGYIINQLCLTEGRGTYFSGLGGYLNTMADTVADAVDYLGGRRVFSTYAGAIETETDQFQPSGYDYIIHVLGDNARESYLQSFRESEFDCAATIREDFSDHEYWLEKVNWFIYREIYQNYHPAKTIDYEIFWEKNTDEQSFVINGSAVTVSLQWDTASSCRIVLDGDSSLNGVADVHIRCDTAKDASSKALLMFTSSLNFKDPFGNDYAQFNLPKQSDTMIGIDITNGHGEVVVTSEPTSMTTLSLDDVYCEAVYTAMDSFLWDVTVSADESSACVISIPKNEHNEKVLTSRASAIVCGEQTIPIKKIEESEEQIRLCLAQDADSVQTFLQKRNCLQVIP